MKVEAVTLRPGNIIEHKGKLWVVVKTAHTQPGKGGAYIQAELKDIQVGTKLNERFRSAENLERVRLDQKEYQYLYMDGDMMVLMDQETFEQGSFPVELLGESQVYIQDGMTITIESHEGTPVGATIPEHVTLEVSETEPVVKGQTAASSNKPAVLENGVRVMVPPFIDPGTKIVVNTGTNEYVERAKD